MDGTPGREFETHTSRRYPLGTQMVMQDGRKFRYVKAGGTALVIGNLIQAPANVANHLGRTPTAAAVNDMTVAVTLGATAATKDQYAGGYLHVLTTGAQLWPIKSHPAVDSAGVLTATLQSGLKTAIAATASQIDLIANPYSAVIQNPTTQSSVALGVAVRAIAANAFGWIQTAGPVAVLTDGTVVLGDSVMASNGTAGAVEAWGLTEAAPPTEITPPVGQVIRVNGTGDMSVVNLKLD
jgi:hypothetical protein